MALLQISEPGLTPDPHKRRYAIGIDLGTTNSLVATVRNGVAECLPDDSGHTLLPSAVRYGSDGRREVGAPALQAQASDPLNTVVSVKRLMGRRLTDIEHHERLPYEFVDGCGMVALRTAGGVKTPVEVSAEILAALERRAQASLGTDTIFGAVITVPAYFDDAQRQATKDAARLAGLNVLRLLNEPTAAAIAYGLDNQSEGVYAVYDLGGGTFDLSILRLSKGVFEVIATGGDSALGGDDYDRMLAQWALDQAGFAAATPEDKREVLVAARRAKEDLSRGPSASLSCKLTSGLLDIQVTREAFDQMTHSLTERTLMLCRKVMRDARLQSEEVQGVVLVGGSTRMPQIPTAVGTVFGRKPLTNLNPDEVVALGASIQADALAGNRMGDDLLLLDVIPLSLGLETMGGLVERIIPRNSAIPTARAQDFTTFKDGQTALALHVVQGERELVSDDRSLARFELRGIPPMAAGAARIRVTFTVDADGLLTVQAQEQTTGVKAQIAVKPSYGLSDDDIGRMLQDSFGHAEDDMNARALREARVEAERIIEATRSALAQDGDLLSPQERQQLDRQIQDVAVTAQGDEAAEIDRVVQALSRGTEAFAAARMNRGIRQALAGRNVKDI